MSTCTIPSHVLRATSDNGCSLSMSSSFSMKYHFSYLSIPSARTVKVQLSCSHSEIQFLPFLRTQLPSKLVSLISCASRWSRQETEDSVLDESYDSDADEEEECYNDADEEEDDLENEDDAKAGMSNWEYGEGENNEEMQESQFPEDPEESYFRPKTYNRFSQNDEVGDSQEDMPDWGISQKAPYKSTGDSKEVGDEFPEDPQPSYMDTLEGSKMFDDDEAQRTQSLVDSEIESSEGSEVPESNVFLQNEHKNEMDSWGNGQEDTIFNEVGDQRGQNVYSEVPDLPYRELVEGAKLYVGNLPNDFDSKKLAELFSEAGIVEIAEVVFNRETDQSRGFGFVTMSTLEEAEKALEIFHGRDVNGRFLAVNKAFERGARPPNARRPVLPYKAYCGNVPYHVDDSRLGEIFSEHGKVLDATIVYDRVTGQSRGFGFVAMSTETELEDAIAALDGQGVDGRRIKVARAEEKPRPNAGIAPGGYNPIRDGYNQAQNDFVRDGWRGHEY